MTVNIDFSRRISGEFKILDFLGSGRYSKVYSVVDRNGQMRAAKFVASRHKELLETERRVIPRFTERRAHGTHYWYYKGNHGSCYVLVMDLLGSTIFDLHRSYRGFCLKSILLIGIQLTHSLKKLHDRGFIHRDIQPRNFLAGRAGHDSRYIYLIDFDIATEFRDNNECHASRSRSLDIVRSSPFSASSCGANGRQSRKTDLESLVYNLVYLRTGTLPWMGMSDSAANREKGRISSAELCSELPREVTRYLRDVKSLSSSERPNYSRLEDYLKAAVRNTGNRVYHKFEWSQ